MTNLSLLMNSPATPAEERRRHEHMPALRAPRQAQPEVGLIAVRRLKESDRARLRRLAERDSAAVPSGELLGAEVDGSLVAAQSLQDGAVIADPFRHSSSVAVELLQLRAHQLGSGRTRRRRLRQRRGSGARARGGLPSSPSGAGGRLLQR